MKKLLMIMQKHASMLLVAVATADVAVGCAGPFGQPEVPECLKK